MFLLRFRYRRRDSVQNTNRGRIHPMRNTEGQTTEKSVVWPFFCHSPGDCMNVSVKDRSVVRRSIHNLEHNLFVFCGNIFQRGYSIFHSHLNLRILTGRNSRVGSAFCTFILANSAKSTRTMNVNVKFLVLPILKSPFNFTFEVLFGSGDRSSGIFV